METILSIFFSTLFSAIIAVAVTRYYYKKQMKKKEITHFLIKSYDIGKGLREVFPDFKISYNNDELAKYVRIYEGYFKNTGYSDVSDYENIAIKLFFPENCIVKAVKIKSSTADLNVNSTIGEKNEVKFIMGKLFKTKHGFEYSAIVESPDNISDSSENLSFEHMLPDTEIFDADKQLETSTQKIDRLSSWSLYIFLFSELICYLLYHFKGDEYPIIELVMAIIFVLYLLSNHVFDYSLYRKRRNRITSK